MNFFEDMVEEVFFFREFMNWFLGEIGVLGKIEVGFYTI